jgi:PAS domain S-box-containing protein
VYSVVLVVVGLGLLARLAVGSRGLSRRQASTVSAASLVPLVAAAVTGLGSVPTPPVDLVPVSFAVSSGVVLVGLFRYQLFDLRPLARDVVVGELRDGVVVVDDHGRIVETNARARELFDIPEGSLLGAHVSELPGHGSTLQRLVGGETDREEFVLDTDGERCFFEATASRFGDRRDSERGRLLVFRDVTERRHTEAEYRALIESSRDLISVLAPDGRRVYCSPSFERVLGYGPDDLVDRDAFDLIHPDDRAETRAAFEELVNGDPEAQNRIEYRARQANGSWRTFESVSVNLVDDPAVGGVVVNARDVTGRRRYEQRLRVLNRVLRHDLRNEMNVIQGHTDMILDEQTTVEVKEHARLIRRKADSLVELGEQTRKIDYTLHSTDGVEKPFELTAPIRERLDDIQTEFPAAIIERDLPDERWVIADDLIDSAVVNVIDNAIEHNDRVVPQIAVGIDDVTHDGVDYVELSVADNGPGIPPAERRVFAEGTETPLSHGSGLGLWLTEWIVSRSNGHLEFRENEPRGTVVRIRLRNPSAEPPSGGTAGQPTATADHTRPITRE